MIEAHVKETDLVHLARLLRVSGERRNEDGEDETASLSPCPVIGLPRPLLGSSDCGIVRRGALAV